MQRENDIVSYFPKIGHSSKKVQATQKIIPKSNRTSTKVPHQNGFTA